MIGMFLVLFGVIRLLHLPAAGVIDLDWLLALPFWVAPAVKLAIGGALMLTSNGQRLRWTGMATTVVACVYCIVLCRASLPSVNGAVIYAMFVYALLGEAASRHECH
jgi:hypothetical protein